MMASMTWGAAAAVLCTIFCISVSFPRTSDSFNSPSAGIGSITTVRKYCISFPNPGILHQAIVKITWGQGRGNDFFLWGGGAKMFICLVIAKI